jgi:hypothetical protein
MAFNRDAETSIELLRFELRRIWKASPDLKGLPYETARSIARDVAKTFHKYKSGGRLDTTLLERGPRSLYFAGPAVKFSDHDGTCYLSLPKLPKIELDGAKTLLVALANGEMRIKGVEVRRNAEGDYLATISFERLSTADLERQNEKLCTGFNQREVFMAVYKFFCTTGTKKLSSTSVLAHLAEIGMVMHAREFVGAMQYAGAGSPRQVNLPNGARPNGYLAEDIFRAFAELQETLRVEAEAAAKKRTFEGRRKPKTADPDSSKQRLNLASTKPISGNAKGIWADYDPDHPDAFIERHSAKRHSRVD